MMRSQTVPGKIRVFLLFGGRSAEHEVSLLSARNVFLALDRDRFDPVLIGIDKQGVWREEPEATLLAATGDPRGQKLAAQGPPLTVPVWPADRETTRPLFGPDDVVFPVLHGTCGEDGTLQGLLDLSGVAYVGAGTLGSAIAMDKDVSKRLLTAAGIPVTPWILVRSHAFRQHPKQVAAQVEHLGYPLFVKPANAGSSVGVHKVKSPGDLPTALMDAFQYDDKVLLETAVDAREIECAVLGHDDPQASTPGEVVITHRDGFYSYHAKYVDEDGARIEIPAAIPPETATKIRDLSVRAFRALELSGLARVDFFVERNSDRIFLNEANTMPGFTAISMYPKMWQAEGVSQTDLITRLIDLARERHHRRQNLRTTI